ncbi:MAG: response regulator [Planctomycetes bacterium]|nr:response regulator [Planctomycetota bacterium]MBL7145198.1 response regulator [Phycisphaerae bacterium]
MTKAKILIAEDDPDFRDSLQAVLESQHYTVITAVNKADGMEKIKAEKPDLAILDIMMSTWVDGLQMSRELKNDPQFKDMPILILTGIKTEIGMDFKATVGDPQWCPVDAYLEKPIEPDVLLAEVANLLAVKT